MCTLAVAVRKYPGFPLVIAANRDEQLTRPASPPRVWADRQPFLAPVDDVAGGTWLGLNASGVFAGVTNRFGVPKDPRRASRGNLVVEALRAPSAAVLHRELADLPASRFNAFHLFYADANDAFLTWSDGDAVRQQVLEPGLHVITERSLGGGDRARSELAQASWPKGDAVPSARDLAALLSAHRDGDPLGSTCVHAPTFNYGTRSSLVLFLADDPSRSRLHWSEGAPCQHPHRDRSEWLAELAAA